MKTRTLVIFLFLAIAVYVGVSFWTQPVHAQSGFGAHGYRYISTATTTSVRNGEGYLDIVTINGGTTGAVTLYDIAIDGCSGTPASGKFATIAAVTVPVSMFYDLAVKNGLCVVTAQATDVTVTFN